MKIFRGKYLGIWTGWVATLLAISTACQQGTDREHTSEPGKPYGLELLSVDIGTCSDDKPQDDSSRIVTIQRTENRLVVQTLISENCCGHWVGDYRIEQDSILVLRYQERPGSEPCKCLCCFGITYTFKLLPEFTPGKIRWVQMREAKRRIADS
ncbi:MAG: hypothetical protein KF690_08455 [Bacteroidetes bacterium]|nr:hypothetical protein [Bacteroidota bacterium]